MVGKKELKGVPYYRGKVHKLEKGMKVIHMGDNIDGKPRYMIHLPRAMVKQLDIKKGDLICGQLWRKWYRDRDTGSKELYTASLVKEELELLQQDGVSEKEETFLKMYREMMESGNVNTAKYIEGQAYTEFGQFRTIAMLKFRNLKGVELAGELVLPEVLAMQERDSTKPVYLSKNGTVITELDSSAEENGESTDVAEDEETDDNPLSDEVNEQVSQEDFSPNIISNLAVIPLGPEPVTAEEKMDLLPEEQAPTKMVCNYQKNGAVCSRETSGKYCDIHVTKACWDCKQQATKDCRCSIPMCSQHDHGEMH